MYGYIVAMVWYVYENMCSTVGHLCSLQNKGNQFITLQTNSYFRLTPLNVIRSSLHTELPT